MEERKNPAPAAKSWTDEIDDLYQAATERNLRAILGTRARGLVPNPKGADEPLPGAELIERNAAAAELPR